jgi:hypothetical protein
MWLTRPRYIAPAAAEQANSTVFATINIKPAARDGTKLNYVLTVKNIENAMMAHIHLGAKGQSGPAAAWLYPKTPPPVTKRGRFSGVLAKGALTAKDLQGSLKGKPLAALVAEIAKGNAYVNVHTDKHPDGEIRGQIELKK